MLQGGGPEPADWSGKFYLKGQSLVLSTENLPGLPHQTQVAGNADVRAWLEIGGGRLRSAVGEVDLGDLQVAAAGDGEHLEFDRISGQLGWRSHNAGWQLAGQDLVVEQDGIVREGTRFAVTEAHPGDEPRIVADFRRLHLRDIDPRLLPCVFAPEDGPLMVVLDAVEAVAPAVRIMNPTPSGGLLSSRISLRRLRSSSSSIL